MQERAEDAKFFARLPVIVNPIGAIPVFDSLTTNRTTSECGSSVLSAAELSTVMLTAMFAVAFMAGGLRQLLQVLT